MFSATRRSFNAISSASLRLSTRTRPFILPKSITGTRMTFSTAPTYKIIPDTTNFPETESTRPDFTHSAPISITKSPYPNWKYGQGVPDGGKSASNTHHEIDPYAATREPVSNYRLLISAVAPRLIGFVSTISLPDSNGKRVENLAPFSYFQLIEHDPPTFVLGFSGRPGREKDTFRNLKETGECVINTVSEGMIEAVNATSIDAPVGISEWEISGLTKAPSSTVVPARVRESVFSVEGKVVEIKEFAPHVDGMSGGGVVLIRASRFWVKEGAADEGFSHIELEELRPVAQLGGIAYGRITSVFERPRTRWVEEVETSELLRELERRERGQES
ncbi:hypothetical protein BDW74DRAFT_176737 [Aspergillus multicolor]|uniref:flavin reductase family protein n=1 Tax=Aspergillus multicolor TaxID=41759 RepID=UPI003CCCF272